MALSEARRRANDKWDKANMSILSCKVKNEYAERVKEIASAKGLSVNAYIKALIDKDMQITPEP